MTLGLFIKATLTLWNSFFVIPRIYCRVNFVQLSRILSSITLSRSIICPISEQSLNIGLLFSFALSLCVGPEPTPLFFEHLNAIPFWGPCPIAFPYPLFSLTKKIHSLCRQLQAYLLLHWIFPSPRFSKPLLDIIHVMRLELTPHKTIENRWSKFNFFSLMDPCFFLYSNPSQCTIVDDLLHFAPKLLPWAFSSLLGQEFGSKVCLCF